MLIPKRAGIGYGAWKPAPQPGQSRLAVFFEKKFWEMQEKNPEVAEAASLACKAQSCLEIGDRHGAATLCLQAAKLLGSASSDKFIQRPYRKKQERLLKLAIGLFFEDMLRNGIATYGNYAKLQECYLMLGENGKGAAAGKMVDLLCEHNAKDRSRLAERLLVREKRQVLGCLREGDARGALDAAGEVLGIADGMGTQKYWEAAEWAEEAFALFRSSSIAKGVHGKGSLLPGEELKRFPQIGIAGQMRKALKLLYSEGDLAGAAGKAREALEIAKKDGKGIFEQATGWIEDAFFGFSNSEAAEKYGLAKEKIRETAIDVAPGILIGDGYLQLKEYRGMFGIAMMKREYAEAAKAAEAAIRYAKSVRKAWAEQEFGLLRLEADASGKLGQGSLEGALAVLKDGLEKIRTDGQGMPSLLHFKEMLFRHAHSKKNGRKPEEIRKMVLESIPHLGEKEERAVDAEMNEMAACLFPSPELLAVHVPQRKPDLGGAMAAAMVALEIAFWSNHGLYEKIVAETKEIFDKYIGALEGGGKDALVASLESRLPMVFGKNGA